MKYTVQSQIGCQLSGQQAVIAVQSDQKRRCQLLRFLAIEFWDAIAYFEAKDKCFYKNGIGNDIAMWWNDCIVLRGEYMLMNKVKFCLKVVVLLVILRTIV